MVREVKIQTEKGGQRKKNDLKEKSFSFRVPDKKKKKKEGGEKKALQNKQERRSHVEPISL